MKTINLDQLPQDLVTYLEAPDDDDLLILKAGKPIGLLRQISDADDLFDNTAVFDVMKYSSLIPPSPPY